MKRGRLPLTALRSFEAAGRLQSFTQAAEELFITQAAVSRQIRELETRLGRPLFERRHRSVHLTVEGRKLLSVLTRSFDEIGASLEDIEAGEILSATTVTVSAEPSFAAGWLARHLPHFRRQQPHIDVALDANPRLLDFRSDKAAIAIRHSATQTRWPRVESRHLAAVNMVAIVAPSLLRHENPLNTPSDLLQYPLLHEENRNLWQRWFETSGIFMQIERGPIYSDGGLILQAVLRGEGVGLVDEFFVRDELQTGRLIQPFETGIDYGSYWLVARSFDALPEAAASLAAWLIAELGDAGS